MNARDAVKWLSEPHYGAFPVTDVELLAAAGIVAMVAIVALVIWLRRRKKQ